MEYKSIKNQVYDQIMKDILDGAYEANAILNEKALIEKYQVSKTPVREALVQLCGEGILNNIPRVGYQLVMTSPAEFKEAIEFRKVIEIAALEMAFPNITKEQIAELKTLNEKAKKMADSRDVKAHWEMNLSFHRLLCSFCGNRYLQKALEDSMNLCTRVANQYYSRLWQDSDKEGGDHYTLVKAIEKKDIKKAKEILILDIELFKNKLL